MMLSRLLVSVALSAALVQGTAFAQSGTAAADKSNLNQSAQSLPQELKQKLNQGFSDVQVVPGSGSGSSTMGSGSDAPSDSNK
jgi:hypothetical protein